MQAVKLAADTDMVVMTREELDELRRQSQKVVDDVLKGRRWTIDDVIKRLHGMRREDFMRHVLIPKRDELESIGAILAWQPGKGGRYLFRATVMADWLEDNLDRISNGGWE